MVCFCCSSLGDLFFFFFWWGGERSSYLELWSVVLFFWGRNFLGDSLEVRWLEGFIKRVLIGVVYV